MVPSSQRYQPTSSARLTSLMGIWREELISWNLHARRKKITILLRYTHFQVRFAGFFKPGSNHFRFLISALNIPYGYLEERADQLKFARETQKNLPFCWDTPISRFALRAFSSQAQTIFASSSQSFFSWSSLPVLFLRQPAASQQGRSSSSFCSFYGTSFVPLPRFVPPICTTMLAYPLYTAFRCKSLESE